MKKDADFEAYMAQLGVKPLQDRGPVQALGAVSDEDYHTWFQRMAPEEHAVEDEDRNLFLQALDTLPAQAFEKDRPEPTRPDSFRKIKRKVKGEHEDVLDLHGMLRDEAMVALGRFVASAFTHKRKSVMVITGKGLRSPGGKSVLKPAVEDWILKQGRYYLRAYAEAPRAFGGRGAYILYLHPPS